MTHRAPEPEVVETEVPQRDSLPSRVFQDKFLPHLAMAAVTIFYVVFYLLTGIASNNFTGASVPQTISVAWTGALATWFGYCIRERSVNKGEK